MCGNFHFYNAVNDFYSLVQMFHVKTFVFFMKLQKQ